MRIFRRRARFRPTLHATILASIVFASSVGVAVEAWHAWHARSVAVAADRIETQNLTASLVRHTVSVVASVDAVLTGLQERIDMDGLAAERLPLLHEIMLRRSASVPFLRSLFVFDVDGLLTVHSSATASAVPRNNSDRPYFQFHQQHADAGVHIDGPFRSKLDDAWILTASRRTGGEGKQFTGIVMATISINDLNAYFATFDMGPQGVVHLATTEAISVARSILSKNSTGSDISESPIFQTHLPQAPKGTFEFTGTLDGIKRVGSYQRFDNFPLVMIVAHGLNDVLADWQTDVVTSAGVTGTLLLGFGMVGLRLSRQVSTREQAERRYRLLEDNSSDIIVCADLDGNRLYASPAFGRLTGWNAEQSVGHGWFSYVHSDDHARLNTVRDQLATGQTCVTAAYRYVCKSGALLWVEGHFSLLPGRSGEPQQFVVNVRDISERKVAEDRLAAANRELEIRASTDGLTGLANRRRFDETLTQEWRRGARTESSLSLLLVDVDHFKLYNDHYGHMQGDECLRAVSDALARSVRRPRDVVARYGGEEFVVLLPETGAEGAIKVAEALCVAVEALDLLHDGNPPQAVVTVSIGVATMIPMPGDEIVSATALVGAADTALYEAKRTGRNRVVSSAMMPVQRRPAALYLVGTRNDNLGSP